MPTITIDREACKGCDLCVHFCPKNLIRMDDGFNARGSHYSRLHDPEQKCSACAICAKICPDIAIEVWR